MDACAVGSAAVFEVDCVVIGIDLSVPLEDKSSPCIDIFLRADNVCVLSLQVVIDRVESLLILPVAPIVTDIVG